VVPRGREKRRSSLSTLKSAFSCERWPDGLDEFHEDMKLLTDRGTLRGAEELFVSAAISEKRYSFTHAHRSRRGKPPPIDFFIVRYGRSSLETRYRCLESRFHARNRGRLRWNCLLHLCILALRSRRLAASVGPSAWRMRAVWAPCSFRFVRDLLLLEHVASDIRWVESLRHSAGQPRRCSAPRPRRPTG